MPDDLQFNIPALEEHHNFLKHRIGELEELFAQLGRKVDSLGTYWRDQKYTEYLERFAHQEREMKAFLEESYTAVVNLDKFIQQARVLESIKL